MNGIGRNSRNGRHAGGRLRGCGALLLVFTGLLAHANVSDCVDTRLGIGVGKGSCMVGPCVPHGSVYPSPDTEWPSEGRKIPPPSGFYAGDRVVGFSQLHTQGTGGVPSYGLFRVVFGAPSRLEILEAHPYRFRGRLSDIGVDVSVSATAHGAIYTHTDGEVTIDALCKIARRKASRDATVTVRGNEIFGGGTYSGNWNPEPYGCWFYATKTNGCLRIAVSFKSVEQAKDYHRLELSGRSADEIAAAARSAWDGVLSRVSVKGLAHGTETAFYTHLFHAFVQPRDRSGDGLGWDDHYTLWDTWKTLFPLMTLVDPDMVAGNVNSFAERFARTGRCEACYTQGREYKVGQGGDEADCVIADASAKDVPGIDWQKIRPLLESRWTGRTKSYRERGWVADGEREDYCWRMKSGSGTMSFAYQDFCAGRTLQRRGGNGEIAARLIARGGNWTNVWNASSEDAGFRGFAVGRRADGSYLVESPRKGYNTSFYEAIGWEYSFFVPHALPELVRRCGGETEFVRRLDFAFGHKLINFGNEPSFLTPWLFAQAGRPDLTYRWAHAVLDLFPADGCPGDDDSGAMGAYYVFLIAGFMPVAGSDVYVLHSPAAERIVFRLPQTGRELTVRRGNRDAFNGRPLAGRQVRHADLLKGGVLEIAGRALDGCARIE